jgi:hypothetical protein
MSDLGLLPIIQVVGASQICGGARAAVGGGVLLGQDLDGGEVFFRPERRSLSRCSRSSPLVTRMQRWRVASVGDGLGDAGQQLDLLVGDGLREADDAGVLLRGDGLVGELLEAGDQRLAEALEAVAVGLDGGVLDVVEVLADLLGRVHAVVEVGDERGDGALEVDVVLPQRVVGVEEQGLAVWRQARCGSSLGRLGRWHRPVGARDRWRR